MSGVLADSLIIFCGVKSPTKKLQSRERNVCVRQRSVSAIFLFNKIAAPIFQIIHIQNKTLDHCVNGGLQ